MKHAILTPPPLHARHGVPSPSLWIVIGALAALTGCERLPWLPKASAKSSAKTPIATSAADSPHEPTPLRPAVSETDIVAKVGETGVITKADVSLRIEELKTLSASLGRPWKPLTADQVNDVLKELVNTELMSQDAAKRGLDRSSEVQRRWVYGRRSFYAQEWLRWSREQQRISAEDVEAFYQRNQVGFQEPERRRLRQLVVSSEEQANKAVAGILNGTSEFVSLAQQIAEGPIEIDGWVMRRSDRDRRFATEFDAQAVHVISLDEPLEAAAFSIDRVNAISLPAKGADNKYHVYQLVERQEAKQRPLTELYDGIKNLLLAQRLQEAITQLSEKTAVKTFEDRLSTIEQ